MTAPGESSAPEPSISPFFAQESEEEGAGFGEYFAAIFQYKWLVLTATLLGFGIGYAANFLAKPRYQASALVQVEQRSGGYTGSILGSLSEFRPIFSEYVRLPAEVVIMESRAAMRSVMEQLDLDILAEPIYFPLVGEAIARHFRGAGGVAKPWFGKDEYAWGGERIQVGSFEVPDRWRGAHFLLVAGREGRFRLSYGNDEILQGKVGERADGRLGEDVISIFIAYLRARPGTRFRVARLPERPVIARLQGAFSASEKPSGSDILEARFTGDDPNKAAATLNAILKTYQRRNLENKSAEADKTLVYLEKQLPPLKERLEAAEEAYNSYRLEHGSIDIQRETQNVLDGVVHLEGELSALARKREELRQIYTSAHPKVKSIDRTAEQLTEELKAVEKRMETLPETQQTVLRLARDVEVNNRLYSELINTIQELRIAKAGTVGNVQIIDEALAPGAPFSPNKTKTLGIYTGGGLFVGLALVFLLLKLRTGIENPEDIERQLGLPVYASIPHSDAQDTFTKVLKKKGKHEPFVLATVRPDDEVVENFRSLRTGLHFLLLESKNNVVLITGPRESVGKTFVALNLGAVLAQGKKKVLLIDADMRRGHLNRYFGISKEKGLSELIAGQADLSEAVKPTGIEGFDMIPTGERPPNPSELLMAETFSQLLDTASQHYDYVIVDAPPVLAVSDAGVIGIMAGATVLVARAGQHHVSELEATVRRLRQSGANVRGFVLNDVRIFRGYGYGYRYGYRYRYSYKKYAYKYGYNRGT